MSIIFLFIDGVGLAAAGADNPLTTAPMPLLQQLLGGPLVHEHTQRHERLLLAAIDATLGVDGLPQSGTGQTALLAGVNAAVLHGRHQPHFPPTALRPLLAQRSIFRRVVDGGARATFANLFGARYWEALAARRIRRSASVIAAEGAGLRFRDEHDYAAGMAVPWDITGDLTLTRSTPLLPIEPPTAGAWLARLAVDHELVFFETFLTDLAGHGRLSIDTAAALVRIDGLIGGVLATMQPHDTLLLTSDHGNLESISAPAHTRNPVPLLVVGADTDRFAHVASIIDIADVVVAAVVAPVA
ncbi:MAG TPA: metalloenzyme [Roseiflexaceae bacterium]|nr:metalloenzyme [Roseiflexaceae bacterium]